MDLALNSTSVEDMVKMFISKDKVCNYTVHLFVSG